MSMGANNRTRSVTFQNGAKKGPTEVAPLIQEVIKERQTWQATLADRFLELPKVDPMLHTVSKRTP